MYHLQYQSLYTDSATAAGASFDQWRLIMGVRSVPVQADGADRKIQFRAYNTSDGSVRTDLVYNTAGLSAQYIRDGSTATTITLATQTAAGAHADGGFVHIGNGLYRLDLPDAATASGVKTVSVCLTHTGTIFENVVIFLTGYDPNAAGADASAVADAVWDELRSGHVVSGSFGEYVKADTTLVSGDSVAADNLEFLLDGTGGVTLSAVLGANAITASSIASNAITSAKIATDAIGAAQIAAGAIASDAFASGAITAAAFAADAVDANAIASDGANEIADAILARNIAGGSSTGRTVSQAFYALRNKVTKTGGVLTVYQVDDTTSSWTAAYTTAAEDAVDAIDPA